MTEHYERAEPVITDNSYESEDISIKISRERYYDTEVYIADVVVKDASAIRTGFADDTYGRNVTRRTSEIADAKAAIFAVNGDFYGFRDYGYVVRNGVTYRDVPEKEGIGELLVIYKDGSMDILQDKEYTAQQLIDNGAEQVLSFGPGLIKDGDILFGEDDIYNVYGGNHPRTVIGMIEPLHYIFLVSDGRTEESVGLGFWDMANIMADYGCSVAYNLDGGGSSTMWFMGRLINKPTERGDKIEEREVSDIVYIKEFR